METNVPYTSENPSRHRIWKTSVRLGTSLIESVILDCTSNFPWNIAWRRRQSQLQKKSTFQLVRLFFSFTNLNNYSTRRICCRASFQKIVSRRDTPWSFSVSTTQELRPSRFGKLVVHSSSQMDFLYMYIVYDGLELQSFTCPFRQVRPASMPHSLPELKNFLLFPESQCTQPL